MIHTSSRTAVALFCLALGAAAIANVTPRYSLEKKVALSDLVVIGRAVSVASFRSGGFVSVHVDTYLKGSSSSQIDVITRGPIAEQNLKCCVVGKTYLFFLKQLPNRKYLSVNGPFGVYPMD
jgi:hypothetical protein